MMMRIFAGLELEKDIHKRTSQLLDKCAKSSSGVKWVKPSRLHLTLHFYGEVGEDRIPALSEVLQQVAASIEPFAIELGGCGAFPDIQKPRVLYVPVMRGVEELKALQQAVFDLSKGWGEAREAEGYRPHVTLGRLKGHDVASEAVRELMKVAPDRLGRMKVERFTLYESRRSVLGAEYVALKVFSLKNG